MGQNGVACGSLGQLATARYLLPAGNIPLGAYLIFDKVLIGTEWHNLSDKALDGNLLLISHVSCSSSVKIDIIYSLSKLCESKNSVESFKIVWNARVSLWK